MKTEVIVSDRPVRVYLHDGLQYIEGRIGSEYSVRLVNTTGSRVKAVVSIDAINALDGSSATGDPTEAGYVIGPWQTYLCRGFRADKDTVGAFKFGEKKGSYAESKGEATNCGVIGVRWYSEKEAAPKVIEKHIHHDHWHDHPWYWEWPYTRQYRPYRPYIGDPLWLADQSTTYGSSEPTYSCSAGDTGGVLRGGGTQMRSASQVQAMGLSNEADFNLGTQWGDAIKDAVTTTEFEVGKLLEEVVYYYTDKAGLEKAGIQLVPEKKVAMPRPFKDKFCEPPVGWKA